MPSQNFLAFCREFNVIKKCLKEGKGNIFVVSRTSVMDDLVRSHSLVDMDKALIESCLTLSVEEKAVIKDFIKLVAEKEKSLQNT